MDVEEHNLAQIRRLNQRGGRMLSIVDLIEDGTLTAEIAGFCWLAVSGGTGFLTGAVPGGVGKTTLMAALLGFLPPGERIVTVSEPDVIRRAHDGAYDEPVTVLAHEIGSGRWFGYIWGRDAAEFLRLGEHGIRPVSCIHADDPEESWESLSSLGARREDFDRMELQLYMLMERSGIGTKRRLRSVTYRVNDRHVHLYRWVPGDDEFAAEMPRERFCCVLAERLGTDAAEVESAWAECAARIEDWRERGVHLFADVRREVHEAYRDGLLPT